MGKHGQKPPPPVKSPEPSQFNSFSVLSMTIEPLHECRKRTFKLDPSKILLGMALYLASGWRTFT
jgi:hypothetical protein